MSNLLVFAVLIVGVFGGFLIWFFSSYDDENSWLNDDYASVFDDDDLEEAPVAQEEPSDETTGMEHEEE